MAPAIVSGSTASSPRYYLPHYSLKIAWVTKRPHFTAFFFVFFLYKLFRMILDPDRILIKVKMGNITVQWCLSRGDLVGILINN